MSDLSCLRLLLSCHQLIVPVLMITQLINQIKLSKAHLSDCEPMLLHEVSYPSFHGSPSVKNTLWNLTLCSLYHKRNTYAKYAFLTLLPRSQQTPNCQEGCRFLHHSCVFSMSWLVGPIHAKLITSTNSSRKNIKIPQDCVSTVYLGKESQQLFFDSVILQLFMQRLSMRVYIWEITLQTIGTYL